MTTTQPGGHTKRGQLLTANEVKARLRCSRQRVYKLISLGELRSVDVRLPGAKKASRRIYESDLEQYLEQRTRSAHNHYRKPSGVGEATTGKGR